MKKETGFTLIEVMIVIAIIAIAGGAGAVGYQAYLPDYRLSSAVRELQSSVQQARLLAVRRQEHISIAFNIGADTFQVFSDEGPNRGVLEPGESVLKSFNKAPGVDFFAAPPASVRFNPRGFPMGGGGDCLFRNNLNSFRGVRITTAGDSRIIKSGDGGATWW